MKKKFNFLQTAVLWGVQGKTDREERRKIILMNSLFSLGIFVLVTLGIISLFQNAIFFGLLDLCVALILTGLLVYMRFSGNYIFCCYCGIAVMTCLCLYLFFTGGVGRTAFMWHYTFPLFSLFLLGARHGAVATLILFVPSALFLLFDLQSDRINIYTVDFAIRFIPSFLTVFLFSYMYEKSRASTQSELELAHDRLEERVKQRTEELFQEISERKKIQEEKIAAEAKLLKSEKMEAIGLMAGGVAHDLNNLLSGLIGYPELLLLKLPRDSEMRHDIEAMKAAGKRASEIVADLLTVARGIASVKKAANLNTLVNEYLHSPEFKKCSSQYPQVKFTAKLDHHIANISCSPVHIKKCLMNLIINGAESIEQRGEVIISTRNKDVDPAISKKYCVPPGHYAVLSVADTGKGISDKDIDHIFEPFYTKKIMGVSGTGLGLAVVWNAVQDHNGGIAVQSSDEGTTFEIFLPITDDSDMEQEQNFQLQDFQSNGEKILVVDDEALQRDIASKKLAIFGYKVHCVSSGEEAVKYMKDNTVDLVLLDMIMDPGMNGRETYEQILRLHPGQKAVIVSGFSQTEDVTKAQDLGAKGFLKKPYTIEELGKALLEELGK